MNVLGLLTAAAGEIGIPAPAAYSSNNQLLYLLYSVARELRASRAFPQQKKLHTITFTASRSKYPLPEDFYSGLLGTGYNQTRSWQLVGPTDDAQWNYWLYGPVGSEGQTAYRIFGPDGNLSAGTAGGQLQIDPAPTATDTISFEYITKNLFMPVYWTASTAFSLNTYCSANGNIYKATVAGTTGSTAPSHTSSTASDGTVTWTYISAAYETALASTDQCLFDDDVIIQGLKAAWYKAKKQAFEVDYQIFKQMIGNAQARWNGSHIGSLTGEDKGKPRYLPSTSGGWSF